MYGSFIEDEKIFAIFSLKIGRKVICRTKKTQELSNLFSPILSRYNWHILLYKLKVYNIMI